VLVPYHVAQQQSSSVHRPSSKPKPAGKPVVHTEYVWEQWPCARKPVFCAYFQLCRCISSNLASFVVWMRRFWRRKAYLLFLAFRCWCLHALNSLNVSIPALVSSSEKPLWSRAYRFTKAVFLQKIVKHLMVLSLGLAAWVMLEPFYLALPLF